MEGQEQLRMKHEERQQEMTAKIDHQNPFCQR